MHTTLKKLIFDRKVNNTNIIIIASILEELDSVQGEQWERIFAQFPERWKSKLLSIVNFFCGECTTVIVLVISDR